MDDFNQKLQLLGSIFNRINTENTEEPKDIPTNLLPLQHGTYYGGMYNGKKYMYSEFMIKSLPIDKFERTIKKQIGFKS